MTFSQILTIVLIVLKLIGIIDISWLVCFAPLIVSFVLWIILILISES